jgi:hypothetical protein
MSLLATPRRLNAGTTPSSTTSSASASLAALLLLLLLELAASGCSMLLLEILLLLLVVVSSCSAADGGGSSTAFKYCASCSAGKPSIQQGVRVQRGPEWVHVHESPSLGDDTCACGICCK